MRVCITVAVLMLAAATSVAQQTQQTPQSATLNLNNADIRVLINTVSEATGKNFIIDPRVKAKVTVISSKSMSKDEIYEVFLSILDVHGFSAVPGEGIIKIVPDVNAKQGAVPTDDHDYDDTDQLVTRVLQLENVAANQLVPILRPLVPQQGHLAAYTPTNVLVITDRASNISRLLKVIHGIDRAEQTEIKIVKLKHASASDIVRTVNALMQQQAKDKGGRQTLVLTTDERTNSILITGDKPDRDRVLQIIRQLDTELETSGNTKVIFLKYAVAKDLVAILQGISSKALAEQQGNQGGTPQGGRKEVDIQADETNNALVITAQPSMIQQLESIVRQLDIPRSQVLIEAIIAEVSVDLASELGAQFVAGGEKGSSDPIAGGFFPDLAGNLAALKADPSGITGSAGLNVAFGKATGSNQFAFVLRALKSDASTNILSTPTLVTLDNVEAEIVFGQNVPFVTGSYANTGGVSGANPFQTIDRQDVGLTLKIKPQINEGDAIKLEIEQEISSLATSAVATSDVVTNKRSIKTEVLVNDAQTIVLGGLIEDRFIDTRQKVPVLGSIPILGRLFSYTKTQKVKSNLMVFIRPVILTNENNATDYFTAQKYSLLRARQLEAKINERGLIRSPDAELPDIELLFAPLPKSVKAQDQ